MWSNPHATPVSILLCGSAWYIGALTAVIMVVIIVIFCWSDSANRKLLLLVTGRTGKEVFFSSFPFPPNTSLRVFLGVGVEEMRLGPSGKVSC